MKRILLGIVFLLATTPAFAQDAIPLATVQIHNSPDVRSWTQTATLTRVEFGHQGVHVDFTKEQAWPDTVTPGWAGPLEFTLWLFVQVNGQWHAGGLIEFWRGREWSGAYTQPSLAQHLAENWIRDGRWPLTYTPAPGEAIGLMVTAGDQRGKDVHAVTERSNVVFVPLQDAGVFTFAEQPPSVPPPPPPIVTPPPAPLPSAPTCDVSAISAQLTRIEFGVQQTDADVQAFRADVKSKWDTVSKFVVERILPAAAAWWAGQHLRKGQ